jgi:two-component system, NtrC family, response regulator AtoC
MPANSVESFRLLVVSRDSAVLRPLCSIAESRCWHLETAASGWDAMERVQSAAPRLVLLDIPRGDSDSLQLLAWLRRLRPELPIVALCQPEDSGKRKEVIRLGAKDVLVKPCSEAPLALLIEKHLGLPGDGAEVEMASEDLEALGEEEFFLSVSPAMQKLRAQAELLAQADVPVLILGEPGSGKGTLARLIHKLSVYSGFKFLRVNCAEMPGDLLEIELFGRADGFGRTSAGKLETGEKGTLLLDEITQMPLALQARLLQFLQARHLVRSRDGNSVEVGVRILATASEDVNCALDEKRLRPDLYHRLSEFTVNVPPLRQRKEEIKVLLRYFMHKLARYYGLPSREFSPSALAWCKSHSWPGNMKELEAFVKRYLVAGDEEFAVSEVEAGVASPGVPFYPPNLKLTMPIPGAVETIAKSEKPASLKSLIQSVKSETERNAIADALEKTGWNRKAAARLLGLSYRAILYKIDQYNMSAPEPYVSSLPATRFSGLSPAKGNGKAS